MPDNSSYHSQQSICTIHNHSRNDGVDKYCHFFLYSKHKPLSEQFCNQIFSLFCFCVNFRIGDTVNISRDVHFSLFQTEPVDMNIASLNHEHSLFRFQQYFIQIKRQYVQYSRHHTCLSVIDYNFMCFWHLLLFHSPTRPFHLSEQTIRSFCYYMKRAVNLCLCL